MVEPVERVMAAQRRWASARGVAFDPAGYTRTVQDNLFRPLHPLTLAEFKRGKGDETRKKLRALRSSSALVCNLFDYWRGASPEVVAAACLAPCGTTGMCFERQLPGLREIGPHLDVEFTGQRVPPTGVESKFLEPYPPKKARIKVAYLRPGLWKGMPRCRALAEGIHAGDQVFNYLDVPQLLAHVLGMVRAYGRGSFRLVYLWFDVGGAEADQHRAEVVRFQQLLGDEIDFQARTHQQVFEHLRADGSAGKDYCQYLAERYFSGQ
jgi:hypothetical protein